MVGREKHPTPSFSKAGGCGNTSHQERMGRHLGHREVNLWFLPAGGLKSTEKIGLIDAMKLNAK